MLSCDSQLEYAIMLSIEGSVIKIPDLRVVRVMPVLLCGAHKPDLKE
jgi:hypothetical protein